MGDIITIHKLDGMCIQVNSAFEKIMGKNRSDVIGRSPVELGLMTPAMMAHVQKHLLPRLLADGTVPDTEMPVTDRNGKKRIVAINWSLIRDEVGKPSAIINVAKDITRLKEAEAALKEFSRKTLAIREEEKKKLAADLHDEIGAAAVSLTTVLSLAEEEIRRGSLTAAREKISLARERMAGAIDRLKQIAMDLRPPQIDIMGLPSALNDYFSAVSKHLKIKIRFSSRLGRAKIEGDAAIALYRVAQEALSNVIRHSHATLVTVELRVKGRNLVMTVKDNGSGFCADKKPRKPSTIGLIGMKERLEYLNGNFEIQSRPGKGTSVTARLPLKGKGDAA
jgi:PAS domain S-box-containing protein